MVLGTRKKILLIEDNEDHVDIILRLITSAESNFGEVIWANTLNRGLSLLKEFNFEVVLLDLRLPDAEIGDSLPEVLKASGDAPIVVLSSLEDKELAKKLLHDGAQDYLCKNGLTGELLHRTIMASIERKRIEIELRESETRKSRIIESSLDCIVTVDEQGKIIEFNPAAELTLGYKKEAVLGKKIEDLFVPERFKKIFCSEFQKLFSIGNESHFGRRQEVTILRKDNVEFPAEVSFSGIRIKNKLLVTGFFRDITIQKRAEESLRQAKELAEESNKAKSAFLANMSHEIRTPLGAILGFSEELINPNLTKEERTIFSEGIKRNGELLSKIINDILDLSKVEVGKMGVEKQLVRFHDIISDVEHLLDLRISDKPVKIKYEIDKNVPNFIHTDPIRLKQVLLNIIGNAVKFTEAGLVNVHVEFNEGNGKQRLIFRVQDTGCGISEENYKNLFLPFGQLDSSSSRAYGGTGLGLILSKKIAGLLGGDVELTSSKIGVGSEFTISIDPSFGEGMTTSLKPQVNDHNVKISPDVLSGVSILLVDDSSDNRLIANRVLTLAGAKVDTAENGLDALTKAANSPFDIVLMDLQMPIMDGYQAAETLRKRGYSKPIIALTAHALTDERKKCLESGFDEHISKPIDRHRLIGMVHRYSHM